MLNLEIGNTYFLNGCAIKYINHYISENNILSVEAEEKTLHYFDNNLLSDILEEYPTLEYERTNIKIIKPIFGIFGKQKKVLDGYYYSIGKRFITESNNWQITYWNKFETSLYNSGINNF